MGEKKNMKRKERGDGMRIGIDRKKKKKKFLGMRNLEGGAIL